MPASDPPPRSRSEARAAERAAERGNTGSQPSLRRGTGSQPITRRGDTGAQPITRRSNTGQQPITRRGDTGAQPITRRGDTGPQPLTRRSGTGSQRPASPTGGQTVVQGDHDTHHLPRPRRFTIVLVLAALVLLLWAGACFVDSGQPALVALTALAPLISVLALPVLAVAVAGRQVVPAVITVLAAIVPWALVTGSAVAGPGPTSAAGHNTLRVMTVDAGDGRASAPSIVRTARNFGVHTLVVTGLTNSLAHDLTLAGLNSVVLPRWVSIPADGSAGVGMWSASPISAATPVPGVSQPSAVTRLSTPSGPISLVVAHAGGTAVIPDSDWRKDLKALDGATPSGPRVLAGDLGGTPWHPAFRALRSHGWHEAADVLGRGLRPTWPSWGPVPFSPLDQVLVGGGVGVSSAGTITIAGTSHRALLVTLVLPGNRTTAPDA